MNIIGKKVSHKTWGNGTVINIEGDYMQVEFSSVGIKKFGYPDAFEKHITLDDQTAQNIVMEELRVKLEKKKAAEDAARAAVIARVVAAGQNKTATTSGRKATDVEHGFGPDYHVEHLARQPILTYQQVEDEFGIQITGFGKGINNNGKDLVLISSVDKKKSGFVYHDHWDTNGDYIYSGEGKTGDQKMTGGNKAIKDSTSGGKAIHLFVKLSPEEYYYQGVFKLVDFTYEDDKDENGNIRKEYKFRLRKVQK